MKITSFLCAHHEPLFLFLSDSWFHKSALFSVFTVEKLGMLLTNAINSMAFLLVTSPTKQRISLPIMLAMILIELTWMLPHVRHFHLHRSSVFSCSCCYNLNLNQKHYIQQIKPLAVNSNTQSSQFHQPMTGIVEPLSLSCKESFHIIISP